MNEWIVFWIGLVLLVLWLSPLPEIIMCLMHKLPGDDQKNKEDESLQNGGDVD